MTDSTARQYCFHLWRVFHDSTHVLDDLFDGKNSAGSWAEWIAPKEGDSPFNGVRFSQSLLGEYKRLRDSIGEHIDWIHDHSDLPPEHKKHIKHLPPDGYALFLDSVVPSNVLLADTKGKPKIRRSTTATYWTLGLGNRVKRLLRDLQNDFGRLKRLRKNGNDEDHFLYSLPKKTRENWDSFPPEVQDLEVANLGARRVFDLRNQIVKHLGLGQDFGIIEIRLENEIDDLEKALGERKVSEDDIARRYFELRLELGTRDKQKRYEALEALFKAAGIEYPPKHMDSRLKSILSDAAKRNIKEETVIGDQLKK